MARVYGRVHIQNTEVPLQGDILFEPWPLGYILDDVLYAHFAYRQTLTETGGFAIDVMPGEYIVHLDTSHMLITVPAISEVTLRELMNNT